MSKHDKFKPAEATKEIIDNEDRVDIGEVATRLYVQHAELSSREATAQQNYQDAEANFDGKYTDIFNAMDRLEAAQIDVDTQYVAARDWKDDNYDKLYEDAVRDAESDGEAIKR